MKRAYEIQRQLKLEGLEYAAKDMLELAAVLRQDPMPQKIPESIEKLLRRHINFIRLRRTLGRLSNKYVLANIRFFSIIAFSGLVFRGCSL